MGGCHVLDGCDESISLTRNRDDVVVLVGALAKCTPHGRDLTRQIVFIHDSVWPHAVQQLVFAYDVVAMLEEHYEDVERLRGDRHGVALAPQRAPDGVQDERTESAGSHARSVALGLHLFSDLFRPLL